MKKLAFIFLLTIASSSVFARGATAPQPATGTASAATGVRKPTAEVNKFWNNLNWADMSADEQKLWAVLGWNEKNWQSADTADDPRSENATWAQLTKEEQAAGTALGYDQKSWDAE